MSTLQVPGFEAANRDNLHIGCWAEQADGSLLLVESVRDGDVRFSAFDRSGSVATEHYGTLAEDEFKARFSNAGWVWHDKSPFPWASLHQAGPSLAAKTLTADMDLKPALTH